MKKLGFTIAEVLIALGIVGVVAAISIPGLITENKKKVWANTLSVAVSNFENAMTTYIITEGEISLLDMKKFKDEDIETFVKHFAKKRFDLKLVGKNLDTYYGENKLKGLHAKANNTATIKDEIKANIGDFYTEPIWEGKNGIMYIIAEKNTSANKIIDNYTALQAQVAKIMIDVNGKKTPNKLGRDVFLYVLGDDGHIFPLGGSEVGEYEGSSYSPKSNCTTKTETAPLISGAYCAALLAKNDYKMEY